MTLIVKIDCWWMISCPSCVWFYEHDLECIILTFPVFIQIILCGLGQYWAGWCPCCLLEASRALFHSELGYPDLKFHTNPNLCICNSSDSVTTTFCTCHDSTAVVACAKFCCDLFSQFWVMANQNLGHLNSRCRYKFFEWNALSPDMILTLASCFFIPWVWYTYPH